MTLHATKTMAGGACGESGGLGVALGPKHPRGTLAAALLAGGIAACAGRSITPPGGHAPDGGGDATCHGGSTPCRLGAPEAGADAPDAADAPRDNAGGDASDARTDSGPGTVYNDFTNGTYWSSFDTSQLDMLSNSYAGGTFDGRYVYFAPFAESSDMGGGYSGLATRYDTTASFTALSSWATYDVSQVDAQAKGFSGGAAFDGRFVYLIPGVNGRVARYDTTASLGSKSSWVVFDLTTVNAGATTFQGSTFDGRYVYLVPTQGLVVRFDTTGSFTDAASWSTFAIASRVGPGAGAYFGAVFDGRYVYLIPESVPGDAGLGAASGLVERYDTHASFGATSSWSTFDTATVTPRASGFNGGVFDGRYVTFLPDQDTVAVRYDTRASFADPASWGTYDTAVISGHPAFTGGCFDGRFVYMMPADYGGGFEWVPFERYDTAASFTSASAWARNSSLAQPPAGWTGCVFDGRFVYPVPLHGKVFRFDAKSPPSMPSLPAFHGSFY